MNFDFALAWSLLPRLAAGAGVTVSLLLPTLLLGAAIAVPVALGRLSRRPWQRWPAWAFSVFFRGTPTLVLLYMIYHGVPMLRFVRRGVLWDFFGQPYYCAVTAFTLNHAAFLAEILRGGLGAVPRGVIEAGQALALSPSVVFFRVRLPIALRLGFSGYQNEIILLTKGTAVVGAITLMDILAVANDAVSTTYDPFTPLVMAALVYWAISAGMRVGFRRLEQHLNRHLAPAIRARGLGAMPGQLPAAIGR